MNATPKYKQRKSIQLLIQNHIAQKDSIFILKVLKPIYECEELRHKPKIFCIQDRVKLFLSLNLKIIQFFLRDPNENLFKACRGDFNIDQALRLEARNQLNRRARDSHSVSITLNHSMILFQILRLLYVNKSMRHSVSVQ